MSRYPSLWPDTDRRPCRPLPSRPPAPGHCCGERWDDSVRVPLFDDCPRPWAHGCPPPSPAAPPVTIVNPCNCRERATVLLSIDECGNLVVQIRR